MFTTPVFTAAFSILVVLASVGDVQAQHWTTRPGDWGNKGVILTPPNRETQSTLPVMVYPDPKPAPLTPVKPNVLQFQSYDSQGRPVFANSATGKTAVGNELNG